MIKGKDEHEFIKEWKAKFKEQIDFLVSAGLEANPGADIAELREDALLEKLAVVYAGCVSLGERVKELEQKVNKNT